jgi:hypothetical protein
MQLKNNRFADARIRFAGNRILIRSNIEPHNYWSVSTFKCRTAKSSMNGLFFLSNNACLCLAERTAACSKLEGSARWCGLIVAESRFIGTSKKAEICHAQENVIH